MPNIPTQPVSTEMYLIMAGLCLLISISIGALAYFIRGQFERTMQKLDELARQRTECRETLPDRFADKKETSASLTRVWTKVDGHETRLSVLESKLG